MLRETQHDKTPLLPYNGVNQLIAELAVLKADLFQLVFSNFWVISVLYNVLSNQYKTIKKDIYSTGIKQTGC